jgi:hypothetical protein
MRRYPAVCLSIVLLSSLFTASSVAQEPSPSPRQMPQGLEVSIGVRGWKYDRVYPLLDGMFQDIASSQVPQLKLDSNASNGANLDAVIQSMQIQAGYGQLAGIQNSVAAQMALSNLGNQSLIAQQSQNLLQQSLNAQQQLFNANQALLAATNTQNQPAMAEANQSVQYWTSAIASLKSQQALMPAPATTPWTPTPASNVANGTTAFTSQVPATTLTTGTTGASTGPSFPPTKQLDNQADLLWARLARIVGAMAQPDSSQPTDRLYLLEFDTSTFPNRDRKSELLDTTYKLTCGDKEGADVTVVDVFPRTAALNITDTRYKDQGFNLGAVISFFGFGVNAAYNREHLRMTQLLGQSSYITGYGVGTNKFGWKFGIPLGDQIISSDIKRTFALIRVAATCTNPKVDFDAAWWGKPKNWPTNDTAVSTAIKTAAETEIAAVNSMMVDPPAELAQPTVTRLDFNRVTYDQTKYSPANPAIVSLVVQFSENLDPQVLIYANGVLIKRARDTFGRAVASSMSPSLLEVSALGGANTWMPTSAKSILLNLDGGQFGQTFPTLMFVPPSRPPFQVGPSVPVGLKVLTVSGKTLQCRATLSTPCLLPSLSYKLTSPITLSAYRWQPKKQNAAYKVVFTANAPPTTVSTSAAAPSGTSVQLVSGSQAQVWGSNVEVYASSDSSLTQMRMSCTPAATSGERLICDLGAKIALSWTAQKGAIFTGSVVESGETDTTYKVVGTQLVNSFALSQKGDLTGQPTLDGSQTFSVQATKGTSIVTRDYQITVGNQSADPGADHAFNFHIIDVGHAGGPIEAWTQLPDCTSGDPCISPTVWDTGNPTWDPSAKPTWKFTVKAVNIDSAADQVAITGDAGQNPPNNTLELKDPDGTGIYSAEFSIAPEEITTWYDSMNLSIAGKPNWKLLNVKTLISPTVTDMSPDFKFWSGTNLSKFFDLLSIGSAKLSITCQIPTSCVLNDALPKDGGTLSIGSKEHPDWDNIPLMKLNADGTRISLNYVSKPDASGTVQPAPGASASSAAGASATNQASGTASTGTGQAAGPVQSNAGLSTTIVPSSKP